MVLKRKTKVGTVDFIHPSDDAIDLSLGENGEPVSNIDKYKETWDFDKYCVLKEDVKPTVFKLNFSVNLKKKIAIKNSSIGGFGKDEETGFKLGSHSNQVVRSILIDIVYPDGTPNEEKIMFKRDKQLFVHEDTMEELEELEIVDDIYSFWLKHKENPETIKKKS